jgi:ketosteroid isomerase-like protein
MTGQAGGEELHPTVQAEREIRRINSEWVDALVRGDADALDLLMEERCVFTYVLEGDDKGTFLSDIRSGELRVDQLKRDNVEVRVYGHTGVLTALDTSNWLYKGHRILGHYRTIHVYAQLDGEWKIVAIQASPISVD